MNRLHLRCSCGAEILFEHEAVFASTMQEETRKFYEVHSDCCDARAEIRTAVDGEEGERLAIRAYDALDKP